MTAPNPRSTAPPNPLLGVLNLIDPQRTWPLTLDTAGVQTLLGAAQQLWRLAAEIAGSQTGQALTTPWQPHQLPGMTSDLLFLEWIQSGAELATIATRIAQLEPVAPHRALDITLVAGLAWRTAASAAGAILADSSVLNALREWDEEIGHAARWSRARLTPTGPSADKAVELLRHTGWKTVKSGRHPLPRHDRWGVIDLLTRPRSAGEHDENGWPLEQDQILVARRGEDTKHVTDYVVNTDHILTWPQLCQLMTAGTPLPPPPPD